MKKVLYFHHAGGISGATRSLVFLLQNIDKKKYEAKVVCSYPGETISMYKEMGIDIETKFVRPFHGSKVSGMNLYLFLTNFLYVIPSYFNAKKIVRAEKPNIIHLNSSCMFIVAMASKKVNPKIKVICHIREPLLDNIFGRILKYMINKYVDFFISIDKNDAISSCNDLSKVDIIYNFVNFDIYNKDYKSNVLREELGLNNDDTLFIVLARIVKCNGILEITKKWNELFPSMSKHKLIIIGDDDSNNIYINSVRKQQSKNVYILKFRNDVVDVIAACDVMVCPFIEPHFSRAVVEAQAMGKPCLVNNIDGVKELVLSGKTAMIYENDYSNLLESIKFFDNYNNLKKYGENSYKHAIKNFNSKINSERTFSHYQSGDICHK